MKIAAHIYRRNRLAMGALALTAMLVGPAATQGQPGPAGQSASEIEMFCGNIVDAARERRYLIQKEELETLEKDINERIVMLETRRKEYEDWLARRNAFLERAEGNLVDIYSRMRPDAAAAQLKELRTELAAGILMKLDAKKASIILNEMDIKAAANLTTMMARVVETRDPS
ncbi:MAG TPA: MotE family protein [Rhizobiaceae bacterium]|nr:MotE family protein [Rhizobiaceae bacterium]